MKPSAAALWPHGDPRDVVRAVLADPRFRAAAQRPGEKTWLDDVLDALGRFWSWIVQPFRHLTGGGTVATVVGWIVVAAVVIALCVLLLVVITRLADRVLQRRAAGRAAGAAAIGAGRDARALLDEAAAAASAGRYREAAVLLWASALRALDERGRVRFDPSRSPGEWRREVRDAAFDTLARQAVVALFGDRAVDAEFVERMRAAYDRVLSRA